MDIRNVTYPQFIAWNVNLTGKTKAGEIFGKETGKRIKRGLEILKDSSYTFEIHEINNAYFDTFVPLYEQNISKKRNPKIFDVRTKILTKINEGNPYQAISLYKNTTYVGGIIFGIRPDALAIAYRVFPKNIDIKMPINFSFIADYLLYQYAFDLGKKQVWHGTDRNIYGLHASIGLPMFKLQAGAIPLVASREDNTFLTGSVFPTDDDVLLMLGDKKNEPITKAILITQKKDEVLIRQTYNRLFHVLNPFETIILHR